MTERTGELNVITIIEHNVRQFVVIGDGEDFDLHDEDTYISEVDADDVDQEGYGDGWEFA